jgi:glycerol-3-phosphate acyltransferase PlsY
MLAVGSFPIYLTITMNDPSPALLSFGCAMLVFVCYTHRANIARMRSGTESRAQRLWLLRPR